MKWRGLFLFNPHTCEISFVMNYNHSITSFGSIIPLRTNKGREREIFRRFERKDKKFFPTFGKFNQFFRVFTRLGDILS